MNFAYMVSPKQIDAALDGAVNASKNITKLIQVEAIRTNVDSMIDANTQLVKEFLPIVTRYNEAYLKVLTAQRNFFQI